MRTCHPAGGIPTYHRRDGRLCPPCMTAEPCCRAGPACPAGKHAYRAAGHMGPALQDGRDKPPVGDGVLDVPP